MRLKIRLAVFLLLACAACGGRSLLVPVTAEPPSETAGPLRLTNSLATPEPPSETPAPTPTFTPRPPTPTAGTPPPPESWSGAPTYPESLPGYLFRVDYDPATWRRGDETLGEPSLVHRWIEGCVITQAVGRGLPPGWSADNSFQTVGSVQYEVVRVSRDGALQYVNYFGGDGNVFTGFRVSFTALPDDCLHDAEIVLATLTSILPPTP